MYPLGNLLHPLQHLAELPRVHRRNAEVTGPNLDLIGLGRTRSPAAIPDKAKQPRRAALLNYININSLIL
jgi:hypothetical protein